MFRPLATLSLAIALSLAGCDGKSVQQANTGAPAQPQHGFFSVHPDGGVHGWGCGGSRRSGHRAKTP